MHCVIIWHIDGTACIENANLNPPHKPTTLAVIYIIVISGDLMYAVLVAQFKV